MISRKGFTLIELMVVIFIVGILAAVAIPIMRGRIDSAKWSEGKSAAGSIRTAIRAVVAEKGNDYDYETNINGANVLANLGFAAGDLTGRYFVDADFAVVITNGGGAAQPTYLITVTAGGAPEAPTAPPVVTLTQAGVFSDS